jgi:hypothetical protein
MTREVEAHVALIEEDLRRRGLSPEEARLEARRTFGGVELAKELHRSESSFQWMEDALQDLRYGLRSLIRNRGFTAATIITLALGLGVNVAVFSLVYGVLLRPLPYANGDRLIVLHHQAARMDMSNVPFSVKEIEDIVRRTTLQHRRASAWSFCSLRRGRARTAVTSRISSTLGASALTAGLDALTTPDLMLILSLLLATPASAATRRLSVSLE